MLTPGLWYMEDGNIYIHIPTHILFVKLFLYTQFFLPQITYANVVAFFVGACPYLNSIDINMTIYACVCLYIYACVSPDPKFLHVSQMQAYVYAYAYV